MSLISPIQQWITLSRGQTAVLSTPLVGTSKDYDPTAPGDFAPSGPQTTTVRGIWSDSYEDGFQEGEVAVFTIAATAALPNEAAAERSTLLLDGRTYRIVRARRRVYMGAIDGFNLFLAA